MLWTFLHPTQVSLSPTLSHNVGAMKDPTRIPAVLEELRATWEGQPDLSLATLFGILENKGVGWGADDAELVLALQQMRHQQPARIGPEISSRFVVNTSGPDSRITIDPYRIVLRRLLPRGQHTQPGVWDYDTIDKCEVGAPLRITDAGGINHRLGVVDSIELVSDTPERYAAGLRGVTRELIDTQVLLFQVSGERTVVLDRTLNIFTARGRELHQEKLRWKKLIQAKPGEPLLIARAGNNEVLDLGVVEHCFHLEG